MKRAKFYCENCRHQVRSDAKVCPHCGRFFAAVRCPSCGFTAESDLFLAGCPKCGYATQGGGGDTGGPVERYDFEAVSGGATTPKSKKKSSGGLPSWFYPLSGILLLVCFLALVILYLAMSR